MENDSVRDAQEALNVIESSRAKVADRLVTPWWYHPVLGLLAGAFVVAYTIGGLAVMMSAAVVFFLGIGLLMGAYKDKTGVWINGLKAGRASWWTLPLVVIMIVCLGGAYYFHHVQVVDWPAWAAGIVVFVAVNVCGRRFDVALRSQLRETP